MSFLVFALDLSAVPVTIAAEFTVRKYVIAKGLQYSFEDPSIAVIGVIPVCWQVPEDWSSLHAVPSGQQYHVCRPAASVHAIQRCRQNHQHLVIPGERFRDVISWRHLDTFGIDYIDFRLSRGTVA